MGEVALKYRIMPESPDSDIENIVSKLAEVIPDDATIGAHEVKPFAFGLNAIMVAILGAVGFDGKTCPQDQPPSVSSLVFTYIILSRAFKLVSGLGYYMFPIREKVLEDLLEFKAAQVPK